MAKLIEIIGKPLSGEWGADDVDGTGIPVLRTTNFTNEGVVNYNDVVTRQISKKNISEKWLRYGDIILEKSGGSDKQPVGRVIFFEGEENKYLFNNFTGLLRVRDSSKWLPKYVFYALFANYHAGGTTRYENRTTGLHNLQTDSYIASVEIPDCSIDIQRRIVAHLDKVVELIGLQRMQAEKLDMLVKSRFIELFGDPVDNDKDWPTEALDSVCSTIVDCPHSTPSYTSEDTGYMCIRSSIVKKNRILWNEIEYIPKQEYRQRIQRKKPEKGDIVYTREGAILGIAAMIDRDCNVALGQRSMLLSPNTSKCLPQFLSVAMNFDSFLRKALGGISGSASPHINVGDIKAFAIILPPIELQEQFAAFVEQTDKSKLAVQQGLQELEILKKALMQQYFG